MNITVTIDEEVVTLVDVDVNGQDIYLTYVTSANNLETTKKFYPNNVDFVQIGTSATVN